MSPRSAPQTPASVSVRPERGLTLSEAFLASAVRGRWAEFLELEPAILPLPEDFDLEGERFVVVRRSRPGRRIAWGRVPRRYGPAILLQAAAANALWNPRGFWVDSEELLDAAWSVVDGAPRLRLASTPRAVVSGRPVPPASEALAPLALRLFRRGSRIPDRAARVFADRLRAGDASSRRAEFWVAAIFRAFPELTGADAAPARAATSGLVGSALRDPAARGLLEKARALLAGRPARLFVPGPAFVAGGALGLEPRCATVREASRRLRSLASDEPAGPPVWIAVAEETWDSFSRRAFESAARGVVGLEVRAVSGPAPRPQLADEWRREIFVPCGTLAASLRFYDWLAEAATSGGDPRRLVDAAVGSSGWAAFVADPTGSAPVPRPDPHSTDSGAPGDGDERAVLAFLQLSGGLATARHLSRASSARPAGRVLSGLETRGAVRREGGSWRLTTAGRQRAASDRMPAAAARRLCGLEKDPERKILLRLLAGDESGALAAAESVWSQSLSVASSPPWFDLAAGLVAAGAQSAWLDTVEAEREIAGGRPEEAERLLLRAASNGRASADLVRRAGLRRAEALAISGRKGDAGRLASEWRSRHPDAPAAESVRAIRLEAVALARCGEHDRALRLLDASDLSAAALSEAEKLENVLVRATVLSLQGKFAEEEELFESARGRVTLAGDDALFARFLAQEALGLSDRRRFGAAAARLEQALAILQDDPGERSRILLDLAAVLFHGGRPERCEALLAEALVCAGAAGRQDLARLSRSNRVELAIRGESWEVASAEIERLTAEADRSGDALASLVALHHASRLALRRGDLPRAAGDNARARELAREMMRVVPLSASGDNARARELALRIGDRLEIGELWLEEGDRRVYEGDVDGAREAWARAAEDPPDRCDTRDTGRARLRELVWHVEGALPVPAREAIERDFVRDPYAAAETVARWSRLFPADGALDPRLQERAARTLRERGGEALADRVFGRTVSSLPPIRASSGEVGALRDALARAFAGQDTGVPPEALGIAGLELRDSDDRVVVRLGRPAEAGWIRCPLDAGAATYELALSPEADPERAGLIGWIAGTLLYRLPPSAARKGFTDGWSRFGIVTADPSMEQPYHRLVRFATQGVPVHVRGESGTGKEAVARAVHALSTRAKGPFVPINVPAIPAALLESELFGHARGAFTGADRERPGLLEEANLGTVFFDEIGDFEPALQAKLLRALQEGEVRRLGENRTRRTDVRIVSATSRDLAREVEAGRFREDLYYRLHVAVIPLPPLRDRGRDVLVLARHFVDSSARDFGRGRLRLSPEASAALGAHPWPGNVRELQNAIAHAAALAEPDGSVLEEHLPESIRRAKRAASPGPATYRSRLDAHRRDLIADALERAGGNRSRAARDLGLSRQALLYLIRELNLPPRVAAR